MYIVGVEKYFNFKDILFYKFLFAMLMSIDQTWFE